MCGYGGPGVRAQCQEDVHPAALRLLIGSDSQLRGQHPLQGVVLHIQPCIGHTDCLLPGRHRVEPVDLQWLPHWFPLSLWEVGACIVFRL